LIRAVAAILAALNSVAPSFPEKPAAAVLVRTLASQHDFDPFTMLAYVERESRWNPSAVGEYAGETYVGLGQLRLSNYPCKDALGFVYECDDWRPRLLDWRFNLAETGRAFVTWREYCKDKVGSAAARHWLQGVTGWDAKRGTRCGFKGGKPLAVPAPVVKLLKRRAELAARF
jgi:hypothetical protein